MNDTCVNCRDIKAKGQFWFLKNYHGLHGTWCSKCYDLIAHDGYDNPKNPTEYLMILLKQEKRDGKKA